MSQTERIIFIDKELSQKRFLTTAKIANSFEISTRQVKRDIEYMRDRFDAPIIYDHSEHYYKYKGDFSLTNKSEDKTLIFKAIFENFSNASGLHRLSSSLIAEGIDNTLDESSKNLSKKILFLSPIVDLPNEHIFSVVSFCMKNNYCIKFNYVNLKDELSNREVQPLRLVNDGKAWYLIAYDLVKKNLRNFHLSRMENPQELIKKYTYDEDQINLEQYISSGFGIFMNTVSYIATIEFFDKAAKMVRTQTWHKEQKVKIIENKLFLTIPFCSYDEILSKILSYGCLAKPTKPQKLVEMWRSEIKKMNNLI